jgi:hypothetical protein
MKVSKEGYIERRTGRLTREEKGYRDWWIVRATVSPHGNISFGGTCITFPASYVGKKIRLKVEIVPKIRKKKT